MIEGIKHIIFDLGGVILNIDYSLTEKAFIDLGITNFGALYSQREQSDLFNALETGKIEKEVFLDALHQLCPPSTTTAQLEKAWNAMLLDFPIRRLQILQQLRPYYDLFLLSNTNEIHEAAFNELLLQTHGMPSIGVFFDKIYYSHKVGLRKPDKEIFELVLSDNGLNPEHTLFIDDSPQHIETAKGLNIATIYLEKGMTIEKDIFKPKA